MLYSKCHVLKDDTPILVVNKTPRLIDSKHMIQFQWLVMHLFKEFTPLS